MSKETNTEKIYICRVCKKQYKRLGAYENHLYEYIDRFRKYRIRDIMKLEETIRDLERKIRNTHATIEGNIMIFNNQMIKMKEIYNFDVVPLLEDVNHE